ncbi:SWIM zinc finger family protein [Flammeovirga sp. EKP202]|uniref:SWIM zinc finger family protein n=1 Tax=Flammeovirga sp. EKP202 TaxID=2770592 RepID=UPI00165F1879|nr:SWIM zinc finger family protein [Flammeovirga sp. EKP202]MBD0403343.1 SWIM zinc finger family protein [Flammeovirga sp. EKP202]
MEEQLNYCYQQKSDLNSETIFLSQFSEIHKGTSSCLFWGKLKYPYYLSRCLITLSNVVKSSFNLSPFQIALLKDPIVTVGNQQIRFEGFSHCVGVYARVDVLEDGLDGEVLEYGTTNVDFNQELITALGKVNRNDQLSLSVGKKEVGFHQDGESFIERKVPLPTKWIKGLSTVQLYFSQSNPIFTLTKVQALQLFKTLPVGKVKEDYYLSKKGNRYSFTIRKEKDTITIGGIHRLKLLQPLLPLIKEMSVYEQEEKQSVTFVLVFEGVKFNFSLSRNYYRGFSGEGALLDGLLDTFPEKLIKAFDSFTYTNQTFNPTLLAVDKDLDLSKVENLTNVLAGMGLLGYDLETRNFYYRRLPFKLNRILSLNPRLKGAEKLIEEGKVKILSQNEYETKAEVEGSGGIQHYVLIQGENKKCTCTWYSKNQGTRGLCKHILAVLKLK